MPISFPSSPSLNQTYTVGTKTWIWNGYAWDLKVANTVSVTTLAEAAYAQANTASANTVYLQTINNNQNTNISSANTLAQAAFDAANTASANTVYLQTVNNNQNTNISAANTLATAAYAQANSASGNTVALQSQMTTTNTNITNVNTFAGSAFNTANTALANTVYLQTINNNQNTNISAANTLAQAAFDAANTAAANTVAINALALAAYGKANAEGTINTTQNTNIAAANTFAFMASFAANSAYTKANNALANTTGTLAGTLTVTGNVIVGETIVFKDNTQMRYNPSASPATFLISSANSISVQSGNNKIFSFDPSGNLGVPDDLVVGGNTSIDGDLSLLGGSLIAAGNMTVNGTMVLANSNFSATEAALTIKATANVAIPSNDGYMIHISGKNGVPSRVVTDSYGANSYVVFAGRAARGTISAPSALQANDVIARLSSNGYGTTKYQTFGVGRIDFVAAENFTDANTGSQIQFWNCPVGSNTLNKIASFNGDSVEFTGAVRPDKGFIYTPTVLVGAQTAFTIDFSTTSLIKATLTADLTISLSNYVYGKVVEVWLTNTGGITRTITHGCTATNSSENSATFTMPGTSSAYLRYFSIDGDNANTFVAIQHA